MQRTGGERHRTRGAFADKRGGRTRGNVTGPKGLFAQGIWQCNCSPRLPAEHFKVKKEGPNKGRWFYTCQQSEPQRCGFFLWEEEAKPREEAAILSNARHEPGSTQEAKALPARDVIHDSLSSTATIQDSLPTGKGMFAGASLAGGGAPSSTLSSSPSPIAVTRSGKRTAQAAELDDDSEDDFGWALSGQDEENLTKVVDLVTPQKAVKMGVYDTPATSARKSIRKLPWLQEPTSPTTSRSFDEPVTPSTNSTKKSVVDYFATPSKPSTNSSAETIEDSEELRSTRSTRVRFADVEEPTTPLPTRFSVPQTLAPPESPSPPTRKRDALQNPADARAPLTKDVLAILSSAPQLPAEILSRMRSVLSTHDLRTQGVIMGRDVLRRALHEKDARIVELEAKCARLESSVELEKSVAEELRWKLREAGVDDTEEF